MSFALGLFKFSLFLILFIFIFLLVTDRYANHYKLYMIFGKKGAGKSTTLAKLARQHIKRGWTVYSTEHIDGVYYIPPEMIGFVELVDFNYHPFNINDYPKILRPFISFPYVLIFCY